MTIFAILGINKFTKFKNMHCKLYASAGNMSIWVCIVYSNVVFYLQHSSERQLKNAANIAEIPTKMYIILDKKVISPNRKATKSNLNAPTNPQFNAPNRTRMLAIKATNFMFFSFLCY